MQTPDEGWIPSTRLWTAAERAEYERELNWDHFCDTLADAEVEREHMLEMEEVWREVHYRDDLAYFDKQAEERDDSRLPHDPPIEDWDIEQWDEYDKGYVSALERWEERNR